MIPIEINVRKQKWLIISIYWPPKQNIKYFLENLVSIFDFYTRTNDPIIKKLHRKNVLTILKQRLVGNHQTGLVLTCCYLTRNHLL